MAKAQDAETANRMFRRGYRADIQLEANTYQQSFISTSHGYSFGNGFYIGGGAAFGVEFQPDFEADPFYPMGTSFHWPFGLTKMFIWV